MHISVDDKLVDRVDHNPLVNLLNLLFIRLKSHVYFNKIGVSNNQVGGL